MKKVGFSANRCIRDIAEGRVNLDDVVSITASTLCETKEHWIDVVEAYYDAPDYDERSLSMCDHDKIIMIAHDLWDMGKIHQPRLVGAHKPKSLYTWMDLVHTSEDREHNPALRKAWEQAQMLETLISPPASDQPMWHPV
jgi:hypothetical protein